MNRDLAAQVRQGDRLLGGLVRMPNEQLTELAGWSGMDFVLIDVEHGPGDGIAMLHHLALAHATGSGVIVRVGSDEDISRALDLGADGILVPHVSSCERARELVKLCHYPPRGVRGFAAYTRAARYGLVPGGAHYEVSLAGPLLFLMIEDGAGVAAASDIAGVPGVDGLMLGPADLAVELGLGGNTAHPRIEDARRTVRDACVLTHRRSLVIVDGRPRAEEAFRAGADLVVYNLQQAITGLVQELVGAQRSAPRQFEDETLMLLSGMLGDASVWDGVVERLPVGVASTRPRIDLHAAVSGIATGILETAPDTFVAVGHSLGGIVAMEVVRQAPERVSGLVLISTSGRAPTDEQLGHWQRLQRRVIEGDFAGVSEELARQTLPEGRGDLLQRNLAMADTVGPEGLVRQLEAQSTRPNALSYLRDVRVPTLIVSGSRDTVCSPALQAELASIIPGATHLVVDCGHMSPLEMPGELAELINAWRIEQSSCGASRR